MKGVLLINLGTPDAPTPQAVRRYLREFLMDPEVIDIPWLARFLLVQGIIAPFRAPKSAHAYQQIWQTAGSPLLVHSLNLAQALQKKMEATHRVVLGMRYQKPSIFQALQELKNNNVDELIVVPLYPQYALSSTESSILKLKKELLKLKWNVPVKMIRDFYAETGFINAWVAQIKKKIEIVGAGLPRPQIETVDHILFSYHGLPERHLTKLKNGGDYCFSHNNCCEQMSEKNRDCYRAQCFATTQAITKILNLTSEKYSISFQSRLGRTPWIKPYTDLVIPALAQKGIKKLAILCPSFVADCLETLEEINIRARDLFLQSGGEEFTFIPCLNNNPEWVDALYSICVHKID